MRLQYGIGLAATVLALALLAGLGKMFTAPGRVRLQGIIEAFNLLNTENLTNYNGIVNSNTYLQPASSTDIFYQPRQLQFAFRVLY